MTCLGSQAHLAGWPDLGHRGPVSPCWAPQQRAAGSFQRGREGHPNGAGSSTKCEREGSTGDGSQEMAEGAFMAREAGLAGAACEGPRVQVRTACRRDWTDVG